MDYVDLKFDLEKIHECWCMMDFYEKIGAIPYFEDKYVTDVKNVYMNREQCEWLNDLFKRNIRKLKMYKHYKEEYTDTIVAFDWLNYSPVLCDELPKNVVRLKSV